MPPGYQTRFAEIQRLSAELQGMDRMGKLMWETGPGLKESVREAFTALKYDVETPSELHTDMIVRLDGKRRLLVLVGASAATLERRSPELAQAFQILHETAGADDRVVFVSNAHGERPPSDRPDAIAPDALALLTRMGVNLVTSPVLFTVWSSSVQDMGRARAAIDKLHAQDGGVYKGPNGH
jgi:hypothetical protein